MEIDWTKPLEAHHPDGRVVAMEYYREYRPSYQSGVMHMTKSYPNGEDSNEIWREDGSNNAIGSQWTIRNTQPKSPPIPDDIAARAVELVKKIAADAWRDFNDEARAILSDLEPVDHDLAVARNMAANIGVKGYLWKQVDEGMADEEPLMIGLAAGIAKGRQMQKDGE